MHGLLLPIHRPSRFRWKHENSAPVLTCSWTCSGLLLPNLGKGRPADHPLGT
jgi:hypothetical protein